MKTRQLSLALARFTGSNHCAWRAGWETIEQARKEIADYIQRYHHRPHSGIRYRTPTELAATWRQDPELQTLAT